MKISMTIAGYYLSQDSAEPQPYLMARYSNAELFKAGQDFTTQSPVADNFRRHYCDVVQKRALKILGVTPKRKPEEWVAVSSGNKPTHWVFREPHAGLAHFNATPAFDRIVISPVVWAQIEDFLLVVILHEVCHQALYHSRDRFEAKDLKGSHCEAWRSYMRELRVPFYAELGYDDAPLIPL